MLHHYLRTGIHNFEMLKNVVSFEKYIEIWPVCLL